MMLEKSSSGARTISRPDSAGIPSAPFGVDSTGSPVAKYSRIFIRVPPPYSSGTTAKSAAARKLGRAPEERPCPDDVSPFGEASPPPLVVLGDRVKLGQIEGEQAHSAHVGLIQGEVAPSSSSRITSRYPVPNFRSGSRWLPSAHSFHDFTKTNRSSSGSPAAIAKARRTCRLNSSGVEPCSTRPFRPLLGVLSQFG